MKQLSVKPHLTAFGDRVHVNIACSLWGMAKISFLYFFHGFHASHVYPKVPESVSCVHPKNKKCGPRDVRATPLVPKGLTKAAVRHDRGARFRLRPP